MPSKRWAHIATGLLLAVYPSSAFAEDVTLDLVTQAWKQAQEKVHSATFRWETRKWMAKGSQDPLGLGRQLPEDDVTLDYDRTLTFSQGRLRYENSGSHWNAIKQEWVNRREIYTWDDEKATRYNGDKESASAFILDDNIMLANTELRPIQMMYRMHEPHWYVFDAHEFEISPSNEAVNGVQCWNIETARRILREKIAKNLEPLKAVYTVCPARDHGVVRYVAMNDANGMPTLEIEIEQAFDEEFDVWVPTAWTITRQRNHSPIEIETSTVRDYSLNSRIDDDEFALELPAETMVSDTRVSNVGGPKDYVVRPDGQKREVTREEMLRGATRRELARTETGMAGLRQSRSGGLFSSPVTYVWGVGILLLLAAAGLAIRNHIRV